MAARPAQLSPARACAFAVVRRVFEQDAYADRAFAGEAGGLEPRDRALAMALSYGTVQRRATLDHIAAQLLDRRLDRLEARAQSGDRQPGKLVALGDGSPALGCAEGELRLMRVKPAGRREMSGEEWLRGRPS